MNYGSMSINDLRTAIEELGNAVRKLRYTGTMEQVNATKRQQAEARRNLEIALNCCTRCGGDGIYKWGAIVNGVATFQGVCFRCGGDGQEPSPRKEPQAMSIDPMEVWNAYDREYAAR